jgi:histone demethylase JARID1
MAAMTATLNMRPHMNSIANPPPPQQPALKATKMGVPIPGAPPMLDKIIIPLSARHAEPLDLNTVERRGQPTQVPDFQKISRPHGLQEAPTFRPTEEEFKNPMEYIRKIAPQAKAYGICKIIPPDGWNPDFAIDTEVRSCITLLCARPIEI